jgi:dethiobiotin synthetase
VRAVFVTGTGTGVGKTVAVAVLAGALAEAGRTVVVVKPTQTGLGPDEPGDLAVVTALSGCRRTVELVRLPDPLAPDTAARLRGVQLPPMRELAARVLEVAAEADVTLVEGAGGLLVRLDTRGGTLIDLAKAVHDGGVPVDVVIVTSLALGTLNHTELTVSALETAALPACGLVLGAVPDEPGLAEQCNLTELPRVTGLPVIASIPEGVGEWSADDFTARCSGWASLPPSWTSACSAAAG